MTALAVESTIGGDRDAVPQARRLTRESLGERHPDLVDDAALVVTELVTNGLLHGVPAVVLRLLDTGTGVRVGMTAN